MSKKEKGEKAKDAPEKKGITRREFVAGVATAVVAGAVGAAVGSTAFPRIEKKEVEVPKYKCPYCEETFDTYEDLVAHAEAEHPWAPPPVYYSWTGKVLDANLTTKTYVIRDLAEVCPDYKDYIGGRGLGVYIVYKEVPPEVDALDPENVLVFATGPLTGTSAPSSGRHCIVSKSPLMSKQGIFDSQTAGYWGPLLKAAGFDAVILRGKAPSPVYLWVHDEKCEFKDATHLLGKETYETTEAIKAEIGKPFAKVSCIGPAGENLVLTASVICDADKPGWGRACGRDGGGAILGSKNLKAIAVYGTKEIRIADTAAMSAAVSESLDLLSKSVFTKPGGALNTYGTAVLVNVINGAGIFPTYNFKYGMLKEAYDISGEALKETGTLIAPKPCYPTCPIACGRVTKILTGTWAGEEGEGPEYETIYALGSTCGVSDLGAVTQANYRCNQLGLDTISAGNVVGCAMELCKEGKLALPGYPAGTNPFGDEALLVDLINKTALKDGVGADLALGSKLLAEKYNLPDLSMSVKGLEIPAYDGRGVKTHGLAYATSNRGGCHLRAYMIAPEIFGYPVADDRFAIDEAGIPLLLTLQHLTAAIDTLVVCLFTVFGILGPQYAKLLTAATGVDYPEARLLKVGERIWNLERLFNNKVGYTKADDTLPKRMLEDPMPNKVWSSAAKAELDFPQEVKPHGVLAAQPSKDQTCPVGTVMTDYYSARGWTAEGVPTDEKLKELGLTWAK